jgi:hypothetical protein
MYRDQEKSMCAGKSTLDGVPKPIATMPLQSVLQEALSYLCAAKQNVDIADAKLFGAKVCDVAGPCAPDGPNEPIEVLAYKLRDLVQGLVKSTASIETRL